MGDECGNTFQFVFSTLHTYVLKVTLQKRAPVNRTVSWVVTFLRYADGGDKREMSPPPPPGAGPQSWKGFGFLLPLPPSSWVTLGK